MKYIGKSVSLERKEPSPLMDMIPAMLKQMHLASGFCDKVVMEAWDSVTGAAPYTISKFVKNHVLYCSISSSVIRNQLFFQRDAIIEAINRMIMANSLLSEEMKTKCIIKSLVLR